MGTENTPGFTVKVRYRAEVTLFTEDGKGIIHPTRIKSFSKYVDYSKSFTPLFTMTLMLTMGHVKIIKANEKNILCHIKLTKLKYLNSIATTKNREEVESGIVFDTIFVPIVEPEDIKSFRDLPDTTDDSSPEDMFVSGPDRSLNLFEVRMYLNTVDYHLMYKKSYNTVLRGKDNGKITVDSALKYICETCGAAGYILDMPDNVIPYNNIIIPSGNVKFCIDMLQTSYGIYLKDITSFFDLDGTLYIISRLKPNHEFEAGKIRLTNLVIETDREQTNPGAVTYLDNNQVNHSVYKGVEDQSMSIASGEAYGDTIVFSNYGFGTEVFSFVDGKFEGANSATREYVRNVLSHNATGVGLSFEYDELNNAFNMFSSLESLGLDSFYVVQSDGMDCDCLKPNVLFTITVNSNKSAEDNFRYYERIFPIISYIQEFTRDNDLGTTNIFQSFETIVLGNVKKPS